VFKKRYPVLAYDTAARSAIGYWRENVVCLSVCASVCDRVTPLCISIMAVNPTAKVSEQVNRKCAPRNTILQLSILIPITDPIPSNSPSLATQTVKSDVTLF